MFKDAMEYAAESRDTELVEELASWFLKKVLFFYLKSYLLFKIRDDTIVMQPVFILVMI